jgi:hypothetical protein
MLKQTNRGIWKEEFSEKQLKPISPNILNKFGLTMENVKPVQTLDDLEQNPPNIVVTDCKKNFKFIQNFFKQQELKKKQKYVMGLGVFQQLQYMGQTKQKLLIPSNVK